VIALPLVTTVALLVGYWAANRRTFGIVGLLLWTYVIMCVSAIVLEQIRTVFGEPSRIELEPMAYLSLCFVITFAGFTGLRVDCLRTLRIENAVLYGILEWFLILGGFATAVYFAPHASAAFTGDVEENRLGVEGIADVLRSRGVLNSFMSLCGNLFTLAQMAYFVSLVPTGGKRDRVKGYLLLASSLSFVVYVFSYVGRDGVVYWLMTFGFWYMLFRGFIPPAELRRTRRVFWMGCAVLLVPMMAISYYRFRTQEGGTLLSILEYAGMQLRHFNDHYLVDNPPLQYGRHSFPIVHDTLRVIGVESAAEAAMAPGGDFVEYFFQRGVVPTVFATFVANFMYDFGKDGALLVLLALSLATRVVMHGARTTGELRLSELLGFLLLYQTVYWGVFYFKMYVLNYYMLAVVLIALVFRMSGPWTRSVALRVVPDRSGVDAHGDGSA
jgi:oligosaccharide repeat unit polymerase